MANARLRRSGQSSSFHAKDDGEIQSGVEAQTFTDNANGTITDVSSGLIWYKYGNSITWSTWANALTLVDTIASGAVYGLTDSSVATNWRVPNLVEMMSLIDASQKNPAMLAGNPFVNMLPHFYWTSSTVPDVTTRAIIVHLGDGTVSHDLKTVVYPVLMVRGTA